MVIRFLLIAYLLGTSAAEAKKHRRQRQQPAFLIPPNPYGAFSPKIQVHERSSMVHVTPNNEPTVVFARITIPKGHEMSPPHQGQFQSDSNNFLVQSPQPQPFPTPIVEVDPLTPTTYRPPVSQLLRESIPPPPVPTVDLVQNVDPVTPTEPQLVNVNVEPQPQMITYYSDPILQEQPQYHQYSSSGNLRQIQLPTQSHFIQHFTTSSAQQQTVPETVAVYPHHQVYQPHQTYQPQHIYQPQPHVIHSTQNVGGAGGALAGAFSSAANYLKSTASKMTDYVPAFIRPGPRHPSGSNPTQVRVQNQHKHVFEVNSVIHEQPPKHPHSHQQVTYGKAKPGKKLPPSSYYPYRKKYTAEKYAGSMPPPGISPAPQFYPYDPKEPEITYPAYFISSDPSPVPQIITEVDQEEMQTSPSFHRAIYDMRTQNRVRVGQRTPKNYNSVRNSVRPTWSILRSISSSPSLFLQAYHPNAA